MLNVAVAVAVAVEATVAAAAAAMYDLLVWIHGDQDRTNACWQRVVCRGERVVKGAQG